MKKYAEVNLLELTFDSDGKPWLDQVGISLIKVTDEPESGNDNPDVCFSMTPEEWEADDPRTPLYDNVFAWGFADPTRILDEDESYLDTNGTRREPCGCTEATVLDGEHNVCQDKEDDEN